MSKVLRIISNVLLTIIIIVLASYIILRVTNKIAIYHVLTGSMEDEIKVGDYILVYNSNDYKIGDVITYEDGDNFITHRIVKITEDKITTKGDANNKEDMEIDKQKVRGKVVYKSSLLNFIMNYKFIIVAVIIMLFILGNYLINKENEEDKEQVI